MTVFERKPRLPFCLSVIVAGTTATAQGGDDIDRVYGVIQYPLNVGPF